MKQESISKAPPYGVDLLYFCIMGFREPEVADYMRFTLLFNLKSPNQTNEKVFLFTYQGNI